jgi:putative ABC transport system permease protein
MMAKVTLRNLAAHKLRLVLTAVSITLGVAFVAGTLIFTDTMSRQFDDLISRVGQDVAVQVRATQLEGSNFEEGGPGRPVPAAVLEKLRTIPGVQDPVGEVSGYAAVVGKDGKIVGQAGEGPPQLGGNWIPGQFTMVDGRPPRGPAEVALDSETLKRSGYRLNDQVKVVVQGLPPQPATVVGVIDAGDLLGATFTAFDTPTAQRLLLKPGQFTQINMRSSGPSETELRDRVAAALPGGIEAVTGAKVREENKSEIAGFLGFFRTFLLTFALISIFVGAFNIFNTFSMLVAQRTRELALLRAVGAARRQVTRAVVTEAVAVGFVGSTLGLLAGAGLAILLQQLVGIDGSLTFTATPVIWSYAVGIIVTVVAAYFPARRAAKIPPVAAMRDDVALPERSMRIRLAAGTALTLTGGLLIALGLAGVELGGNVMIPIGAGAFAVFLGVAMLAPVISRPVIRGLGWLYPRLFGAPGRMAQQNALRNPRRTAATAAALMIGLALITTVNVMGASMRASVSETVNNNFGADYVVESGQGGVPDAAIRSVTATPGVENAAPLYFGEVLINGKRSWYTAGDSAVIQQGAKLKLLSGSMDLGRDGFLVDADTAKARGWTVGSTVPAQFADGGKEQLRLAGIYERNELLGPRVLPGGLHLAHTSKPVAELVVVNTADTGAAVTASIERALAGYPGLEVLDQTRLKEQAESEIDGIMQFLTVLLTMAIIIAAIGVINTLALSVIERTREIGLLRAVGISRRQLRRMIRLESVVIAVFGALLGLTIGVIFGVAIQHALAEDGLGVLAIPTRTLAGYVIVAAVIGVLAALWPAWRAGRMDVLKAIATE